MSPCTKDQHPPGTSPLASSQFLPTSPALIDVTSNDQFLSSSFTYASSERDFDIEKILDKRVRIPCDADSMQTMEENGQTMRIHLAKALFALLMPAYSVGAKGRDIDTDEIGFEGLSDQTGRYDG